MHENSEEEGKERKGKERRKEEERISSNANKPYMSVIPTCPDNLLITSKI
jgi:hypothetical protein